MAPSRLCLIALAAAIPAAIPSSSRLPVQPSDAVVEELVAEKDPACPADDEEDVMSGDGRKVAWRAPISKKWSVVLNGVAQGPTFDEVRSLVFSPDSQHLAFAGRRGKRWAMVVDGKEGTTTYSDIGRAEYSQDGQRIAFRAKPAKKWVLVVEGELQPGEFDSIPARVFSPDGRRVAYVGRRGSKFIVVLDGKEGVPFDIVGGIRFSADSQRFSYAGADVDRGFGKEKAVGRVVIDGVAGPEFEGRQIGGLLKSIGTGSTPHLLLGYFPQLMSGTHGITAPVFSPDGKRVAYAARRDKDASVVVLDGEPGAALPSIATGPVFSSDSQHVAILVTDSGMNAVMVDGTKVGDSASGGTDFFTDLTFAPDSQRVGYVGITGGSLYDQGFTARARRRVYVNGVAGPVYNAQFLGRLQFTPDGRHLGYVVGRVSEASGNVSFVVVDSREGKRYDHILGWLRFENAFVSYGTQTGRRFYVVRHPLAQTVAN